MTVKDAMTRGALLGFLAAGLIVSLAVAWVTVSGAPGISPQARGATDVADMLLFRLAGTPPTRSFVWPGSLYVVGAALIGCGTGAVASRMKGSARRRTLILLALSPVGPWLLAAVMIAVPPLSSLGHGATLQGLRFSGAMALLSLPLALPYVVYVAPLVAPPVIIAHLVLEGWTRPSSLPAKGFARPGVRRAALMVLISTTTAFTTFALLTASH
jgi:hypothetical protein